MDICICPILMRLIRPVDLPPILAWKPNKVWIIIPPHLTPNFQRFEVVSLRIEVFFVCDFLFLSVL